MTKNRERSALEEMFRNEREVVDHIRETLADKKQTRESLEKEYTQLGQKYEKLLKEIMKITRVGDMNYNKLMSANEQIQEQKSELQELNRELRSANAAKDKLYSIIAHDLMNPLGFLLFSSDLLENMQTQDDAHGTQLRKYAEKVFTTAKNMSELLENLLQWSRSQYGVIHCNPVSVDISKLAGQSAEYYRQNATRKNISILINIPEGTMVHADENMVRCILRNLVGNAIKFTHQGGEVKVTAQREDQSIVVSIKDNGVGMDEEKLDNLFKLGENPTSNGTAKEKGSGLGLILCKEFVEKNGGKIEVLSEVDRGSLFRFSLPRPVST